MRVIVFFLLALSPLALVPSCGSSGFKLPGEEIFSRPVEIKTDTPVLPGLDEGVRGYEHPTFTNADGSVTRLLWMSPTEADNVLNTLKDHEDFKGVKPAAVSKFRTDPNGNGVWKGFGGLDGLMLTGARDAVDQATDLVGWLQASLPQIQIEARIVEVLESDNFGFGFQWFALEYEDHAGATGALAPTKTLFDRAAGGLGIPQLPGFVNTGSFVPDLLVELGTIHEDLQIDLIISALRSFTKVDVVNAPSVMVHAGHQASISAGTQVPFYKLSLSGSSTVVSTEFKEVTVDLQVLPHLIRTATGSIIRMAVKADVKAISDVVSVSLGSATVTNPVISSRTVTTSVDVPNGSTVVLGGLLTNTKTEVENRIPVLGDVPLLEYFFSSRNRSERRSNLLFFLRPKVVVPRSGRTSSVITPPEPGEMLGPDAPSEGQNGR